MHQILSSNYRFFEPETKNKPFSEKHDFSHKILIAMKFFDTLKYFYISLVHYNYFLVFLSQLLFLFVIYI